MAAHFLQQLLRTLRLQLPRDRSEEVHFLAVRRSVAPQGQGDHSESSSNRTPTGRQPGRGLLALGSLARRGPEQLLQQSQGRRLRRPARTRGRRSARGEVDGHLHHSDAHGSGIRSESVLRRLQKHLEAFVPGLVSDQE